MNALFVVGYIFAILSFCTCMIVFAQKFGLTYLRSTYVVLLALGATLTNKIVSFGDFSFSVTVLVISATFFITDAISELWGKKEAQITVVSGMLGLMLTFVAQQIAIWWPAAPGFEEQAANFNGVMQSSFRVVGASLVATFFSQIVDVNIYHKIWSFTGQKFLWLRNNGSTFTSQIVDTLIFAPLAFYGVFSLNIFWQVVTGILVFKFFVALLDTPFIYLAVWICQKLNIENHDLPRN